MPQVLLSQDVCMSHCLEIQVARCPLDPCWTLGAANFSRKGWRKRGRSFPCGGGLQVGSSAHPCGRWGGEPALVGPCPRGGICRQLGPSQCPPPGLGGGVVVTAALKHLLSSCFLAAVVVAALQGVVRGTPAGSCSKQLGKCSFGFCWCQRFLFLSSALI